MTNISSKKIEMIGKAREILLAPVHQDKYIFEAVTETAFWDFYSSTFYKYSPLDLFFLEESLYTENESKKLKLINNENSADCLQDNLLLKDASSGFIVAMFRGWQKSYDNYYMQFTAVHEEYRRRGIYTAIIDRVIDYTREMGFARVSSCHSPFNNPVLIAKLKKEFMITAMDIDPALGTNIWLCYFHNLELKKAFEVRCGHITFSNKLFISSMGTAESLSMKIMESKLPS